MAMGKEQYRMAMHLPEAAPPIQGGLRSREEAILIALRVADRPPPTGRVDIAHRQTPAFAEAPAKAVGGEEKDPVAEPARGHEPALGLLDGEDIGPALGLWRLDQVDIYPGLTPHIGLEELQPLPVELDRTPGVRLQQRREIVGQRLLG